MSTIDVSLPPSLPDLGDYLATLESKRRRQLDQLPDERLDPVAMAHRAAVVRILDEVSAARQRLATGLYGICAGCDEAIDPERLEFRPWATRCTGCSKRVA
jgi:RNA polymerase-binding transcription factor DksA